MAVKKQFLPRLQKGGSPPKSEKIEMLFSGKENYFEIVKIKSTFIE